MMDRQSVLHGIRILDFTRVLAGPYATRILADFGAEVIKVQPLLRREEDAFSRGYYNTWNRNKLGVTLDLGKPEGVAVARRLAGVSDAVVENFTPRVMANWGLDYDSLRRVKLDIIMVSMSAMGSTGPRRDYTGFGPTVQAFSGMTALASYPGGPPLGLGTSYADHVAGLTAVLALLSALEYRRGTGEGSPAASIAVRVTTAGALSAFSAMRSGGGSSVPWAIRRGLVISWIPCPAGWRTPVRWTGC
jgi:benzylsuccinate CoA-transferase BbsF subunit